LTTYVKTISVFPHFYIDITVIYMLWY